MYPLALDLIRSSLAELQRQRIAYRIEGFMWHQGENDMFNEEYMSEYGKNLANFLEKWRRDLKTPDLKFYIGELCTKTIWGMVPLWQLFRFIRLRVLSLSLSSIKYQVSRIQHPVPETKRRNKNEHEHGHSLSRGQKSIFGL